jgi:hypothetical protein
VINDFKIEKVSITITYRHSMKVLFTLICTTIHLLCFGQQYNTTKITGPELYKLNSTMRADLGGKCRLYVPLNIPENAVYCYVTISTSSGNESQRIANGANLLTQISSKIPSITAQGVATLATLSEHILNVHKGSVVDVSFIPSIDDAQLFFAGKEYRLMSQYSRVNYNGGTITLPTNNFSRKTVYIGLSNNSAVNSTWVNIEAVAVTYTAALPTQEVTNANIYTNLGWQSYKNGNIDKCIEYSQKALMYDSTEAVAMLNLGLCYLIKNDETKAIDFYMTALSLLKQKDKTVLKRYLKEAVDDIEDAREKQPTMASGQDIISLFLEECKNN